MECRYVLVAFHLYCTQLLRHVNGKDEHGHNLQQQEYQQYAVRKQQEMAEEQQVMMNQIANSISEYVHLLQKVLPKLKDCVQLLQELQL